MSVSLVPNYNREKLGDAFDLVQQRRGHFSELDQKFIELGNKIIYVARHEEGKTDCFKWAMQQIGLERYVKFGMRIASKKIIKGEVKELKKSFEFRKRQIILYEDSRKIIRHYALSFQGAEELQCVSRFGENSPVVVHPLNNVYPEYGERVHFFNVDQSLPFFNPRDYRELNPQGKYTSGFEYEN